MAPLFKWIKNDSQVEQFKKSAAFEKVHSFITACANAVKGTPRSEVAACMKNWQEQLDSGNQSSIPIYARWTLMVPLVFAEIRKAVHDIPLHDMKSQRFGNKAFRDWHAWLDENIRRLVHMLVDALPPSATRNSDAVVEEACCYLKDSFGNSTRLDYGTGHELHFFLLLVTLLEECDVMNLPEDDQRSLLRAATLGSFWQYIEVMRLIQGHYMLEPAGSHGVWGLDDYHHLSFIFGASQLCGKDTLPVPILPKHITEAHHVKENRDEYLYFENIAWIRENKKGPFHEHSAMLYNISGIDEWQRITGGMLKMYDAEVLSKYNVVQHLLFGGHLAPPQDSAVEVRRE